ncbi:MAG: TPM domain-containing protein, partial [Deltaproteobacteria bacterium]
HQLVVYIDRSTGGVPIEDWAVRAFAAWRVGRRQFDDGLALFVFSDDRRVRIEVGYGLESVITDAFASRVIRETIAPRVKAGNADGAITGAVDRLVSAIQRGGPDPAATQSPPLHPSPWQGVGLARGLLLGLFAVFIVILAIRYPWLAWMILRGLARGGSAGRGGGGGFQGGGGRSGGGGASGGW